jgi:multiple sugar transport system substrate-binding protein
MRWGKTAPKVAAGLAAAALPLTSAVALGATTRSAKPYAGQTITVAVAYPSPPKAALNEFTRETGIQVRWVNIGWDSLQTKIAAAMESHSYFADATDVDWSRVGEYYQLKWFLPLNKYFNPSSLKSDIPQIDAFMDHGQLMAMPFDASFMVTTVNTKDFARAGIRTMPTTFSQYNQDLHILQQKKISPHPLDIPFAAAEGLSTYWYEVTGALGGKILSGTFQPLFTSPSSPGYRAFAWMVNAYRQHLVPAANINLYDYQGMESEMAQNRVASVFSDYSGQVGTIYNVPSISKVVGQVAYIPTPGASGPGPNLDNPDGIGIPVTARHVGAAVTFIRWFDSTQNQARWAGLDGGRFVIPTFPLPMRVSSLRLLAQAGDLPGGSTLISLLQNRSRPIFPDGAPPWYPQFSSAVYTNLHAAAAGQETVAQAIHAIAATVAQLRG